MTAAKEAPTKSGGAKKSSSKMAGAPAWRMSLAEAMCELEKAGSAQTRKSYARHGAKEPMFGVTARR